MAAILNKPTRSVFIVVDETDLSIRKVEELHSEFRDLQQDKIDCLNHVLDLLKTVNSLCKVLGIDFKKTGLHGLGGRMGTRIFDPQPLIFDHAAQFFTVSDHRFAELVAGWSEKGLVSQWQGIIGELEQGGQFVPLPSTPPRYIGVNGMRPLADSILSQTCRVDVVRPCWISKLEPFNGMWHLSENGKPRGQFDALVIAHNGCQEHGNNMVGFMTYPVQESSVTTESSSAPELLSSLVQIFLYHNTHLSIVSLILNTSPLPSLYEAFAIIDGDERRRLIQASPTISFGPSPISDHIAFATSSGSGPCSSGFRPICSYCEVIVLAWPIAISACSLLQQHPSDSSVTLATSTSTAFHAKTGHPTWVLDSEFWKLDSGANDW
ncbi:FAD/NAD(P)-binding oxidoreductase family protein [Actinidia rufa]|uniref:FAD/NAD(P)-binding oxidoreductase family protein n=1 Tax=Actinidia rufa TaxID=165716 RepID=A0A7J0E4U3_9ERIC|nr:FAD/NAD(P)-binding oxidoreductase family protein [Actinidia rufa]